MIPTSAEVLAATSRRPLLSARDALSLHSAAGAEGWELADGTPPGTCGWYTRGERRAIVVSVRGGLALVAVDLERRGPRPRGDSPATERITVRLTPGAYEDVEAAARVRGQTVAEFAADAAISVAVDVLAQDAVPPEEWARVLAARAKG
jgi:hypothetical protein